METEKPVVQIVKNPHLKLTILAWGAMLWISPLLEIIWRQTSGKMPPWLDWVILGGILAFIVLTWIASILKPLRGFLFVLLAAKIGWSFLIPLVTESQAWINWSQDAYWGVVWLAERSLLFIPSLLMVLTLIGSGIGRRELFLVRGDPSAPAQPTRLLGRKNAFRPWNQLAREWLLYYFVILVIVLGLQIRPDFRQISQALVYLPLAIITAVINAFNEEFQFRSAILARLEPVVGKQHVLWIPAVLFGLGHFYGMPAGPIGVLLATYLGWLFAKSMLETRGFVWAFWLHFIGDFVIYTFFAMTAR
jgi:membrane protease YdiL (CAAX protease family)